MPFGLFGPGSVLPFSGRTVLRGLPGAGPQAAGLLVLGSSGRVTDQYVGSLLEQFALADTPSGRHPLLLLGAPAHLQADLSQALLRGSVSRGLVSVGVHPDQSAWNPLDAPWLSSRALATMLLDFEEELRGAPFPALERPVACDLLSWLLRIYRRLPPFCAPTLSDLYGVLLSEEPLYELFDRHTAWVYEKFVYLFELDEPDYCLVAQRLQSVVLRQADVDRDARAPRADRFLSEGLLGSHGLPATYTFEWCRYRGRYQVQVGDRAYHVMRWLLTAPYFPHAPVAFANYALSQPASGALADAEHAAAWLDSCWVPLPDAVCRRILGRLLAFLRPFTEPAYRASFSCSPERSASPHS